MITNEQVNIVDSFFEIPEGMKKVALHIILDTDEVLMTHFNMEKFTGEETVLRIQNHVNSLGRRTVIL